MNPVLLNDDPATRSRLGTGLLATGLALGLAAHLLFPWNLQPGAGFALWMFGYATLATLFAARYRRRNLPTVATWAAVAVVAASSTAIYAHPALLASLLAVILYAAAMVLLQLQGRAFRDSTVADQLFALLRTPLQAFAGGLPLLSQPGSPALGLPVAALLRGLALALPLLLLFGALFNQADAGFEALLNALFAPLRMDSPEPVLRVLLFGWLSAGLLAAVVGEPGDPPIRRTLPIGGIEASVVMSCLLLLFATFVLLQLPYLFGGADSIARFSGLTLADYARRGFFELLTIAGLSLLVILTLNGGKPSRTFLLLSRLLLLCLTVILLSAAQRLGLYVSVFGLTLSRLLAFAFMIWLVLSLILLAVTVLRSRPRGFAPGSASLAILLLASLLLVNPVALVTRFNIDEHFAGRVEIDLSYLLSLGPEAVPALLEHFAEFSVAQRCHLLATWSVDSEFSDFWETGTTRSDDWRSWNLAEARARSALTGEQDSLREFQLRSCS